jgi:hypothetical protein
MAFDKFYMLKMKKLIDIIYVIFTSKMLRCFVIPALMLYSFSQSIFAQNPLQILINVMEPYPVELDYYSANRGNVFITVSNVTGIEQEIYYHVRLLGNNGLEAETYSFVKPMEPVSIGPFQTIVYTGDDIERDFPFNYPDDVQLTSVSMEQLEYMEFQRALPEGTYVLCVTARDFLTDIPLTFDCSNEFSVYYGDAPQIIEPYNGEVVPANEFSNITIFWRPPFAVTPPAGTFEYELKMIDITYDGFGDIESLFQNPGVFPELQLTNYPDLVYVYNDLDNNLPLVEGHHYALRVRAIDNFNTFPLANNGYSEVSTFWYGYNPSDGTGIPDPTYVDEENPCIQNCYFDLSDISVSPTGSASGFQRLRIGHFDITNLNLSSSNGNSVSGTGTVMIPWLNDVMVNVEFQNLSVNSAGRIFEGLVTAVVDQPYDPANVNRGIAEEMNGFIRNGRVIGALAGGEAMGMPLGLVQNVMRYNLMVGFTAMEFRPDRASCQLMYNMHIPAFGEDGWISLAGTDICLTSGGFAQEFMLHPVMPYTIPFMDDITFRVTGHNSQDTDEIREGATFLEIDCNGIRGFGIHMEVDFPRSILVPDETDGTIGTGNVTGTFFFSVGITADDDDNVYAQAGLQELPEEAGIHFVGKLNIDPFQIAGIQGWGFDVENAWLDCSDIQNPPNIVWPESYDDPNLEYNSQSGRNEMMDTWRGIYIHRAQMKSPDNFLGINGRKAVAVNHLIIDPNVSATISVTNYIERNESNVDNWNLSLDSLFLTIVQNNLLNGGFSGELGMPITDQGQYFRYTALIDLGNQNANGQSNAVNYSFSVSPSSDIHFPFMMARASLSQNSYVLGRFTPNNSAQSYFETFLQGGVGISSDLFVSENGDENLPLYLPVVDFSFNFHSKDGFTNSHLGFANCDDCGSGLPGTNDYDFSYGLQFSEESFVGFPLNIESVKFSNSSVNAPVFTITPRVSLATGTGGVAGSVGIDFKSGMKNINGEQKLAFQSLGVSKLYIQQNAVYGLTLEGEVEFYNTKDQYNVGDKGARGMLQVLLPALPGVNLAAEFGTSVSNPQAAFGNAANYGYWYLDGMMYFGDLAGIPVAPALGLYGLGGGVYVNMSRGAYTGMNQSEVDAMLSSAIEAGGDTYPTGNLPAKSFGSYGMKFAATLGTFPTPFALNMDVSLYAQFSQNMGINMLAIEGAAFAMSPLSARGQTPVWADAGLVWEKLDDNSSIFDGTFNLYVNLLGIITGVGRNHRMTGVHLHVETAKDGKWWFHAGSPENRGGLRIGLPNLPTPTVRADGYFMMGHNLPDELPIPERVAFLMNNPQEGSGKNKLDNTARAKQQNRSQFEKVMTQTASGIAFGAELSAGVDINAWLLYATLEAYVGFDVNVTRSESRTCYSGNGYIAPGINDWYALGQVYAGLEGDMGLQVKFAGKRHRLSLFRMGAAMMLRGGGPNPTWVEGRAGVYYSVLNGVKEGKATFDVTIGERCVPAMGDPFGDLEIIYATIPEDDDRGVSTFESPTATFILPVGIPFDLPTYDSNGDPYTMTVELELNKHNIKREDNNTQIAVEELKWSNDHSSVSVKLRDKMAERTWHIAEYRVIAWEYKNTISMVGGTMSYSQTKERLKDENGANWKEERTVRFRTGQDPYPIPDEVVSKTVPIRRQRYFMRDDMAIPAFELHFTHNIKDGYFPDSNDEFDYEYYIRFEDIDGGEPIIRNVTNTLVVERILNTIPVLDPATIYSVQLVRKKSRIRGAPGALANATEGLVAVESPSGSLTLNDRLTTQITNDKDGVSMSDTLNRQATIDPGQRQESGESIIYQFYFRTSKYQSMTEKLNAITVRHESYTGYQAGYSGIGWDGLYYVLEGDEKFDIFDIRGDRKEGVTIVAPRLDIYAQEPSTSAILLSLGVTGERLLFNKIRAHINPTLTQYDALPGNFSIRHSAPNSNYHDRVYTYSSKPGETVAYRLPYRDNNIKVDLNPNVTGFRGALSDENIFGTSSTRESEGILPSSGLTAVGGSGLPNIQVSNFTEVLRIDYNLFGVAREDALAVRNWALDILSETRTVVFNPINPMLSTTSSTRLKWGNHFDVNHPAFRNSIMDVNDANEFLRSNNRGNYTVKFNLNRQYGVFHIPAGTDKNFTITY